MMRGLRENGENAFLIIPYGEKLKPINDIKLKYGTFDGVPFCFMRNKRKLVKGIRFLDIFIGVFQTASLIYKRKKSNKVDGVIIGGIVDVIRDSPIIYICRLLKIPLYFWLVEKASLSEDYRGIAGLLNKHSQKFSERYLPRLATGVIVISSNLQRHYKQYLPERKILISPILVSENSHRKIDWHSYLGTEKKIKETYKNNKLLVYSGSFSEKDGLHVLIDAIAKVKMKFPATIMVMTGRNDNEQLMTEVENHIQRLDLRDNTFMAGFVNAEELLCYNSLADILFVCRSNSPFANHGFPWKLGEYCMTSKPIIATDVGDISKYFTDNENLFIVEPGNADAIAGKVIEIFENYEHAVKVANRGKVNALHNFGYYEKASDIAKFIHNTQSGFQS